MSIETKARSREKKVHSTKISLQQLFVIFCCMYFFGRCDDRIGVDSNYVPCIMLLYLSVSRACLFLLLPLVSLGWGLPFKAVLGGSCFSIVFCLCVLSPWLVVHICLANHCKTYKTPAEGIEEGAKGDFEQSFFVLCAHRSLKGSTTPYEC